jgi:hypothetical protein
VAADIDLKRGLGNVTAAPVEVSWVTKIPVAGQMILGFVLPFALAFVAIPLEYLISAGRTVLGVTVVGLMRSMALVLRMASNFSRHLATALVMAYDILIFLPILIERAIRSRRVPPDVADLSRHSGLRKTG